VRANLGHHHRTITRIRGSTSELSSALDGRRVLQAGPRPIDKDTSHSLFLHLKVASSGPKKTSKKVGWGAPHLFGGFGVDREHPPAEQKTKASSLKREAGGKPRQVSAQEFCQEQY
jgi:hypothetical protein